MAHQTEIMVNGVQTVVTEFDHSAQEIDDALLEMSEHIADGGIHVTAEEKQNWDAKAPRENLLDNWYFADPVDQRGGYVVPPNTPYYSDTGLTTQEGMVSAYTKAVNVNGTYGTITVSGTTYYVAWSAAVRGYTGDWYGIDRWRLVNDTSTLLITNEGVKLIYDNSGWHLSQIFQDVLRKGITYTYSVLYKASGNNIRLVCSWGNNKFFYNNLSPVTDEWSLATVTGTIPEDAVIDYEQIVIQSLDSGAGTIDIKAAKLELGSQQTLAHQDANGNWVLNEIPNYAEELAKCQRYFRVIDEIRGYNSTSSDHVVIFVNYSDMRISPTVTVKGRIANGADQTINGVSYVGGLFSKNSGDHIHINQAWQGDIKFYNVWLDANL